VNAYVAGTDISGNPAYTDYTAAEIQTLQASADPADFLRSGDKCLSGGTYGSCPSPPNCNFSGSNGGAKLCINRLPTPDKTGWYVAAMKCIPAAENCDKCMCGIISSDNGGDATCNFNGDTPDDDNVKVNCGQLSTASINGATISAPNGSTGSSSSSSSSTSNAGGSKNTTQTSTTSTSSGPGMGSNNAITDSSNSTSSTNGGPGKQKGGRGRLRHSR